MNTKLVSISILLTGLLIRATLAGEAAKPATQPARILGLTGNISDIKVAARGAEEIEPLAAAHPPQDIDLTRMAHWAMNYLTETPRKNLGYEPVFQCHPMQCPPVPAGQDPIVACDTDARMDWEWYYMRDISGSDRGREVEAAFHQRMRAYIDPEGRVWSHPGAFNEGNTTVQYEKKDYVIHIWGATKILMSLSEDYAHTKNPESKELARKVLLALKKLATWDTGADGQPRCWFACGMGAFKADGTVSPNGWNRQPAPIVEPLVTYWLATGDPDGLSFAKAFTEGMIQGGQPDGLRFRPDGSFDGHSHATMHAVWGVAHLGVVTGDQKYIEFARRSWDYLLTRGTGTGWFPAAPDNCNETCCISDMMSIAGLIGQSGQTAYYDDVERYLRNYISPLQFIVNPDFEARYRKRNAAAGEEKIQAGLTELKKFQGGIIGGSGLNDFENVLLGGVSGFEMFGCCAPEGMRAIHTAWMNTIQRNDNSKLGPAGVYVNLSFSRDSKWGQVISFLPEQGRLTVKAKVKDAFFLRPPHWADREQVRAFIGTKMVPASWSGDYVRFDASPGDELTITYPLLEFTHDVAGLWKNTAPDLRMKFQWRGNSVVAATPAPIGTPLFSASPRVLPMPPNKD